MTNHNVRAEIGLEGYLPGQEFSFRIIFESPPSDFLQVTNVSVDLFRAEYSRNQFAFGFGGQPLLQPNSLSVAQKLGSELKPGLHFIGAVTLCWVESTGNVRQERVTFEPVFFAVQSALEKPIGKGELATRVGALILERKAYAGREIVASRDVPQATLIPFRVLIFGVGCLLHAPQQLEGFLIAPLGRGFSHARLHEIVDTTLSRINLGSFPFDQATEDQYEQSTPTFLVDYCRVLGASHVDVLDHCREHSRMMFEVLGLDRGQKPREFFCMAMDQVSGERWFVFDSPWYRGNLVSDFNPVSTANLIESVTPKLQRDPFLRLLIRSYAEATAEDDSGFALLRSWTVMELLADRAVATGKKILHPNGQPIKNNKGNSKDTNAKEARVYQYLLERGSYVVHMSMNVEGRNRQYILGADETHPGYTPDTVLIPLWVVVRSAYAIRNCIAHEGYFSEQQIDPGDPDQILAAQLISTTPLDPRTWVRDTVQNLVRSELNKTS